MQRIITQRLANSTYTKKHSIQEKLTEDEIDEKLIDYKEVADISKVALSTHIRYFSEIKNKDGTVNNKFRLGGILINKDNADKYVVLSNGTQSWSVQVDKTTFYKKMSIDEIKEEYELEIMELKEEIKKLKKEIKKLNAK